MRNARRGRAVLAALVIGAGFGCGRDPLTQPSGLDASLGASRARGSDGAAASNAPPSLNLRTVPAADGRSFPYPTISGRAPLSVRFNLCRSDDADAGDSLNWQFHFGDTRPDTGKPDFEHTCRVDHVYEAGTYTATLSVTDKHQEDQDEFSTAARRTVKLTIVAFTDPPPEAPASPECSVQSFTGSRSGEDAVLSWATAGTVTDVRLYGPSDPLTGLPANGQRSVPFSCNDYELKVTCGNGNTIDTHFQFRCDDAD